MGKELGKDRQHKGSDGREGEKKTKERKRGNLDVGVSCIKNFCPTHLQQRLVLCDVNRETVEMSKSLKSLLDTGLPNAGTISLRYET